MAEGSNSVPLEWMTGRSWNRIGFRHVIEEGIKVCRASSPPSYQSRLASKVISFETETDRSFGWSLAAQEPWRMDEGAVGYGILRVWS